MKKEPCSKPTKEKILDAAFSLFEDSGQFSFSLSKIASKIGITKTAIYRHFKNKDAIIEAMENRFYDLVANCFAKAEAEGGGSLSKFFPALFNVFLENTSCFDFYIFRNMTDKNYSDVLFYNLHARNVFFFRNYQSLEEYKEFIDDNIPACLEGLFCGSTLFYFIKTLDLFRKNNLVEEISPEFPNVVSEIILCGMRGAILGDGKFLSFPEISEERRKELNELCVIDKNSFPKEDKIFAAFVSVLRKYSFAEITVEKIANELNMAKSSLYEYFETKNQMIKSLIEREVSLLITIINENSIYARNFGELIYIFVRTEFEYFMFRPSVVLVHSIMSMHSDKEMLIKEKMNKDEVLHVLERMVPENITDVAFNLPCSSRYIVRWIFTLPVLFFLMSFYRNVSREESFRRLDILFELILNGIGKK